MQHCVHHRAIWRKLADRIGVCRVSCQQRGLTTATAEIDFSLRTTPAWLGHPFRAAKACKTFRFAPNPIEVTSPNIFETQIGNGRRSSRAGEHVADWIDSEITLTPAVETRFGSGLIIIREHIEDLHTPGKPSFRCGCDFSRTSDLFARWE